MIKKELEKIIEVALAVVYGTVEGVEVEKTIDFSLGDYATNAALVYAKKSGKNSKSLAEEIIEEIEKQKSELVKKMEIAGPGFINFFLSDKAVAGEIQMVSTHIRKRFDFRKGEKINIEFVSANPTGQLHIGHGRGAFYGDILANVLQYAGADIVREYYINDGRDSKQIKELGLTALGQGEQYKTDWLMKLIKYTPFFFIDESVAGLRVAKKIQKYNKKFLENTLKINFDNWYSEDKEIYKKDRATEIIKLLKEKGNVYEKDGATWLKTSAHGDDEDRVIIRSDGSYTYFVADIAYHADKFMRGFDTIIDVWGADHHGHVKRMEAVRKMLGWQGELKIFITQLVSLKEDGESKKMSKRAGTVILLEDLVYKFGLDVVRWFFAEKTLNTHMEFDMALAREKSAKNPVYYVQYAHARIFSIAENVKNLNLQPDNVSMSYILQTKEGRAIAMKILQFPEIIKNVSDGFHVHRLTTYLHELASEFSQFYRDVRIINDNSYNSGAFEIAILAQAVLAKGLSLLGVSAPDSM